MSPESHERPVPELIRFVRELIRIREEELRLLERLLLVLGESNAPPPSAGESPPEDPKKAGGEDREWIDQAIDAALSKAFSVSPTGHEPNQPAEEPQESSGSGAMGARSSPLGPDSRLATPAEIDPDLLLVRSRGVWVGLPWKHVTWIGLAGDASGPAESRALSLAALLVLESQEPDAVEPYCVTWQIGETTVAITCEVLGGVTSASVAASREVELVAVPSPRDVEPACRVLSLVEFLVQGPQTPPVGAELPFVPSSLPLPGAPATSAVSSETAEAAQPATIEDPEAVGSGPESLRSAAAEPPAPQLPAPELPMAEAASSQAPMSEPTHTVSDRAFERLKPDLPHAAASSAPSRSALVAVHYLPARVALARYLRSQDWVVHEVPDLEELPGRLARAHYETVFAEPPERNVMEWLSALERARLSGTRLCIVGSRLRGRAGDPLPSMGEVPRLLYPFHDLEAGRVLETLGVAAGT